MDGRNYTKAEQADCRMQFAREFKKGNQTVSSLAIAFGISRLQARLWIYMMAMTADETIALAPRKRGRKRKNSVAPESKDQ